jgi:hypothetical protein
MAFNYSLVFTDLLRLSRKITSGKVGETTLLSLAAVTKSFALNPKNAQNPVNPNFFFPFMAFNQNILAVSDSERGSQLFPNQTRSLQGGRMLSAVHARFQKFGL